MDSTEDFKSIKSRFTSRLWSRKYWLVLLLVVALVLAVACQYFYNRTIIESSIVEDANFSVYAPTQAPKGYQISGDDTSLEDNLLSYSFKTKDEEKVLTVTVQPKPKYFNMSQISKGGSVSSTVVSSGTLYNLSAGGSTQYLLDAGDSLVYITSLDNISTNSINTFAASLVKVN